MALSYNYRQALERIYTLIGKEYHLIVLAVDSDSNSQARELVLASRSMSTEVKKDPSIRQVIRGSVIRYDVKEFKPTDIQAALSRVVLVPDTPIVIAFVGVAPETIKILSDPSVCGSELKALESIVTGGYIVLTYPSTSKLPRLNLCEDKPVTKKKFGIREVKIEPKFLIGEEGNIIYAVRIKPQESPIVVPTPPPQPFAGVMRVPRWSRTTTSWEDLVQQVVERELLRILTSRDGVLTIQLGDGLVARVWPDLLNRISMAKEWTTVFTHQSIDPTPRANYESLETLGDKVLSLSLVHHLFSNASDSTRILDSNGITDSHKEILSSTRQSGMAVNMGLNLPGLIKSTVSIDDKILEDVYEAFFGCLFMVANTLTAPMNQGLGLCEALFRTVLESTFPTLDPWSVPKDPQTSLDQIFIRLGWGHPILNYNEETRVTTIKLTREARSYLESIGKPPRGDVPLAVGPRSTDKAASARAAAEVALSNMKIEWGIDARYASMAVRRKLMRDERYAKVQQEALAIAKKKGFVDIYVARRAKNHNQLYAVMGVRPNDTEAQLHIYKYESPTVRGEVEIDTGLSTRVAAYITALKGFIQSS